jgi:uncharacterized membrane protein
MNSIIKLSLLVLVIDCLFLYNIKNLFNQQIIKVQGSGIDPNIYACILSYIFLIIPLYWFIIKEKKNGYDAFLLGISIYGVYEYTNLALLKNWNVQTTVIDTIWGGCLFAIVTYLHKHIKI